VALLSIIAVALVSDIGTIGHRSKWCWFRLSHGAPLSCQKQMCQMNENVILMSEFLIKSGELGNFKALVKEMVDAIQVNEPNTLIYEIFISEDGKSCQFMERYVDSAALMTHVGNFRKKFGERFWAFLEPKEFKVFGNPSDELKEAVNGVGAMILVPIDGFAR
jgi:quinol monooxygenase YgiN